MHISPVCIVAQSIEKVKGAQQWLFYAIEPAEIPAIHCHPQTIVRSRQTSGAGEFPDSLRPFRVHCGTLPGKLPTTGGVYKEQGRNRLEHQDV